MLTHHQEYYLSVLSGPRPGRGPRHPFSSDVDLAKMGSGGCGGSGSDGETRAARSSGTAFSNHLYNALVRHLQPDMKRVLRHLQPDMKQVCNK